MCYFHLKRFRLDFVQYPWVANSVPKDIHYIVETKGNQMLRKFIQEVSPQGWAECLPVWGNPLLASTAEAAPF